MVIDPSLGKGHSNLPESSFSVLTKFRAKDINLQQTHYQASTKLGMHDLVLQIERTPIPLDG